jgi:WD40 repeat protein
VIVWDTASGAVLTRLTVDALVALTGLHIVERTDHGTLRRYDSRTGEFVDESAPLNVHPDFVDNFLSLISADGRYVAYQEPREAGRGRPIDVWDFATQQEIRVADDALMRSFAAGENLLFYEGYVGSSETPRLAVYDLEAREARILRTYDTWQYTGPIDYSPANGVVTVGIESETGCPGQGTRTEVWRIDGETTELLTTIDTDEDTYTRGVTFSPDGAVMVVQQGEDRLVVMDTLTGEALATLGGSLARFTPDGTRLLITGRDRRAQVWAVAD